IVLAETARFGRKAARNRSGPPPCRRFSFGPRSPTRNAAPLPAPATSGAGFFGSSAEGGASAPPCFVSLMPWSVLVSACGLGAREHDIDAAVLRPALLRAVGRHRLARAVREHPDAPLREVHGRGFLQPLLHGEGALLG